MGLYDKQIERIVALPEWEVIRAEVPPRTFSSLCWYINEGPGYCEDAPAEIQALLRRLGL